MATYGQIAHLIGRPRNARLVGKVLRDAEHVDMKQYQFKFVPTEDL
ncbi:MAG: MGMT family protein [Selenomonas sp.]|nr:MGMT family protein [Selenomonas sp.]MDD6119853.1 MGMT family protein [Selenomonadaceae bacterium]MDD7055649.1 MGMT family protein [Selenomonadaceae bacterium]